MQGMARDGIEPPTQGASILCSTNWATEPSYGPCGIWTRDLLRDREARLTTTLMDHIAGAGFEPTTFGLWARRATRLLHPAIIIKEDVGFEPTREQNPPDGFQDRSLKPLG